MHTNLSDGCPVGISFTGPPTIPQILLGGHCPGVRRSSAGEVVGSGYYKGQPLAEFYVAAGDDGYAKPSQVPPPQPPTPSAGAVDMTLQFSELKLYGKVKVFDIWAQKSLGTFSGS